MLQPQLGCIAENTCKSTVVCLTFNTLSKVIAPGFCSQYKMQHHYSTLNVCSSECSKTFFNGLLCISKDILVVLKLPTPCPL